jgi:hypothetical protein
MEEFPARKIQSNFMIATPERNCIEHPLEEVGRNLLPKVDDMDGLGTCIWGSSRTLSIVGLSKILTFSTPNFWGSFRDAEVNWDHVRVLPNGETVSVDGESPVLICEHFFTLNAA